MNISLDSSDVIQLIILLVLLFLSAFFSSAETAMTTVNRIRIRSLADDGNARAKTLLKITDDPAKFLSAILGRQQHCEPVACITDHLLSLWAGRFYGSNCQRYPYPADPALRRDYAKDHGHDTFREDFSSLCPGHQYFYPSDDSGNLHCQRPGQYYSFGSYTLIRMPTQT